MTEVPGAEGVGCACDPGSGTDDTAENGAQIGSSCRCDKHLLLINWERAEFLLRANCTGSTGRAPSRMSTWILCINTRALLTQTAFSKVYCGWIVFRKCQTTSIRAHRRILMRLQISTPLQYYRLGYLNEVLVALLCARTRADSLRAEVLVDAICSLHM